MRVLVVEDDPETAATVQEGVAGPDCQVELAHHGEAGLALARQGGFDVLVVDRMLPGLDGLSLVRRLRGEGVGAPALLLTALGSVADRVAGLRGGADDYLVKPFSIAELKARIGALARRPAAPSGAATTLRAGDLVLDRLARTARVDGREVELLPLQFKLLEFLMLNAGRLVTRAMLLETVWGFSFDPRTNIVETHISHLRAKIDAPGCASLIRTVRGAGYILGAG